MREKQYSFKVTITLEEDDDYTQDEVKEIVEDYLGLGSGDELMGSKSYKRFKVEPIRKWTMDKKKTNIKDISNMKKAMLSQPMAGKTDEEIVATREKAMAALKEKGYEVINTLFTDEWYSKEQMQKRGVVQIPLCFLAKSLENMSLCHAAYFCKGWEKARGCKIEHDAAVAMGLRLYTRKIQSKNNPSRWIINER